jgi:hypothetical protein
MRAAVEHPELLGEKLLRYYKLDALVEIAGEGLEPAAEATATSESESPESERSPD